jgi:hypothetical protein
MASHENGSFDLVILGQGGFMPCEKEEGRFESTEARRHGDGISEFRENTTIIFSSFYFWKK